MARYAAKGGLRVDFLTPPRARRPAGPKSYRPEYGRTAAALPGFPDPRSRATVILHGPGIYVHVPAPARYAVHKLIVSHRRPEGFAKRDKDLQQSEALLSALAEKRPMS